MSSTFVDDAWELFTWRITSNYVSPWEQAQIKEQIRDWSQWCTAWSRWAENHLHRAEEAVAHGNRATAAGAYIRAGLFYHWGSFLFPHEPEQFRTALTGAHQAFAAAAPLDSAYMEMVDVPFEGTRLPGYFRRPRTATTPLPLVVLIPGADSTKEELYNLGDYIVERGMAIYAFDGPGHGLVSYDLKLRKEYEQPLRAVVDALSRRPDVDARRIALCGISYGGMFAIRGAVFDDRISAVVSMSSWYSAAGRFARQREVSRIALRQYMGPDPAAVQDTLTLEGVAQRLTAPLLQVYGGRDPSSPLAQAEMTAAEVRGPSLLKVFDDGVHVCNNLWYEARPFVADWLAEQLGMHQYQPQAVGVERR